MKTKLNVALSVTNIVILLYFLSYRFYGGPLTPSSFLEEFVNHSPSARDLQMVTNSSRVLPTSHVVYQPITYRNLWSIA